MPEYDTLIKGAEVARPGAETTSADIAIKDGAVAALEPSIESESAANVIDGTGLIAFPGVVDSHTHWGIYNPLEEDADSESRAAAQGGTTTAITYMRTGQYYLNRGGPYESFFPEVLRRTEGRAFVDYAFHLAPMESGHIDEIQQLIDEFGVSSFKIFMFYGGHGLHGRSDDQSAFLMTPPGERYDYAHFEFVMRGIQAAREQFPSAADHISLSLHCETAEIMTAYTALAETNPDLTGLAAYSAARPPHSEGLAVMIAAYLAHETGLTNINLLHLSSAKAMEAALAVARTFPEIDFRREVTIGHLLADIDRANGLYAKVNPPIRPRDDVEALWDAVLSGDVDWVVSDHACCKEEMKLGETSDDVWAAKSGFGGTEYLLAGLFSEGRARGLTEGQIAELLSNNPARRYGLDSKGDLAPGFDADIALLDPNKTWTIHGSDSESTQGYTPFEGFEITGKVRHTLVRGQLVLQDGNIVGSPSGKYLRRSS